MKKIVIAVLAAFFSLSATAQFKTGTLQAAGLTCAMCTKAINETLKELLFVQTVKADIKNSQFIIQFKEGVNSPRMEASTNTGFLSD
jgi:copper chaperone CopZ